MIALVLGAVFLLMALVGGLDQFAGVGVCFLLLGWITRRKNCCLWR